MARTSNALAVALLACGFCTGCRSWGDAAMALSALGSTLHTVAEIAEADRRAREAEERDEARARHEEAQRKYEEAQRKYEAAQRKYEEAQRKYEQALHKYEQALHAQSAQSAVSPPPAAPSPAALTVAAVAIVYTLRSDAESSLYDDMPSREPRRSQPADMGSSIYE